MTVELDRIKEKLQDLEIPFEESHYENRIIFWQEIEVFPDEEKPAPYPVLALTIKSNNDKKDLAVVFEQVGDRYEFCDLFFGSFGFELFDSGEEVTDELLLDLIKNVMQNEATVIYAVDITKNKWLWDGIFDLNDPDPHDKEEFEQKLIEIQKPKKGLSKLLDHETRYEIYNWNTYRCVLN